MPTSARMMVESCTCGGRGGTCTCTTQPFLEGGGGGPARVLASSYQDDLSRARVGARPTEPSAYDRNRAKYLLSAMRKAGVKPPNGGKRLAEAELASMLADRSVSEAINIKMLCRDAEILPDGR